MSKTKKSIKSICHECEVEFTVKIDSFLSGKKKLSVQICPFCGDVADTIEDRPLLKDFDDYDKFNDDEYFVDDDEEDNE
jgi:transcription elongation factor Elf1